MIGTSSAYAQTPTRESYDVFPQSGVLAANGNLPSGNLALPQLPMGMLGQPTPLLGSLSLSEDKKWLFGVKNNTAFPIKVNLEIIQFDDKRSRISNSKVQQKIKPGETAQGKSPVGVNSIGCAVYLQSWTWME